MLGQHYYYYFYLSPRINHKGKKTNPAKLDILDLKATSFNQYHPGNFKCLSTELLHPHQVIIRNIDSIPHIQSYKFIKY